MDLFNDLPQPEEILLNLYEIRCGLEKELDVSIYADPEFDSGHMYAIRCGLEKELD